MLAAVLDGPRRLRIADTTRPTPRDSHVLLRVEGCGICGSDLAVWEGRPWFDYPRAAGSPGHEVWGRVEAVGSAPSSRTGIVLTSALAIGAVPKRTTALATERKVATAGASQRAASTGSLKFSSLVVVPSRGLRVARAASRP